VDTFSFPKLMNVEQQFRASPPLDIASTVGGEFRRTGLLQKLVPGSRIAVGVGSRGITDLKQVVAAVLQHLRSAGMQPFLVPAMGSHGGATPEGQTGVLAGYGITSSALDVPIHASMEVEQLGVTPDQTPVFFSSEALRADAVVVINRVKPHTDFAGNLGSGILKMLAIGFGKRAGASACHAAASRLGHEHVIRSAARVILSRVPVLCGVAILEDHAHNIARLEFLLPDEIEQRESDLVREARDLMPGLPFSQIDLLIVDQIGKDISGAGMDPNVTGRSVQGGSISLPGGYPVPAVRRIYVRGLTETTHGNALGLGLADFTRSDLLSKIDFRTSYINALTALTPGIVKVPIHFPTDREVIQTALESAAVPRLEQPRVVRITDTLHLRYVQVSSAYAEELRDRPDLCRLSQPLEMPFDSSGNLLPMEFSTAVSTPTP
jgi:Lactate racemase N-terminal domain